MGNSNTEKSYDKKTAKKLIEAEESMKPMTIIQSILAECNKRINQTDENLYLQQ